MLVTPMQVARMMGAVAIGGILWKPRLVQRVEESDGALAYSTSSKMSGHVDLSPVVWAFLRSALVGVVNEGGTSHRWPISLVPGAPIGPADVEQNLFPDLSNKANLTLSFDANAPIDVYAAVNDNVSTDSFVVVAQEDSGVATNP